MSQGYDERRQALAEELAGLLIDAGMQRMASRVYAHLFMDDEGVRTAAELAERLRVSPGAISGAVGYLSQVYLLTRERQPGSRRERYRIHQGVMHDSIANRSRILDRWSATMRKGMEQLGPDSPAGARLAENAEFVEFLRDELAGIMERWQRRQAERAAGGPGAASAAGAADAAAPADAVGTADAAGPADAAGAAEVAEPLAEDPVAEEPGER